VHPLSRAESWTTGSNYEKPPASVFEDLRPKNKMDLIYDERARQLIRRLTICTTWLHLSKITLVVTWYGQAIGGSYNHAYTPSRPRGSNSVCTATTSPACERLKKKKTLKYSVA
jgi:hypothetical protein